MPPPVIIESEKPRRLAPRSPGPADLSLPLLLLFNVWTWTIWSIWLVFGGLPLALMMGLLPRDVTFPLVKAWLRSAFYLVGVRVKTVGMERVDWSMPQIFMGNHESLLDHLAVCTILPLPMLGVEKVENLKIPVYGWMSKNWGNIHISREDPIAAKASIAAAAQRLREGVAIMLLPEGTRSRDGRLQPFKKGGFHMAIDTGAPIVPFTINGAWELSPGQSWRVRPGTIEIIFGDAIPSEGFTKENLDTLVARVRAAIEAPMTQPPLPEPDPSPAEARAL